MPDFSVTPLSLGFNRTILECKAELDDYKLSRGTDLIEPYWNVKEEKEEHMKNGSQDLIEPYWNVKHTAILAIQQQVA